MANASSVTQTPPTLARREQSLSTVQRYTQLALVLLAAGCIYPLLYLRQYYYPTMLVYFDINDIQIGQLYSTLGTVLVLCYIPGGWLADRISPRILISFSLLVVGLLGYVYSTAPSFGVLRLIFIGWGLATGLTFWAAVVKRVSLVAAAHERGRFFGMLDGGRGLVEASLATIAVSMFSYFVAKNTEVLGFRNVLYLYSTACVSMGVIIMMIKDPTAQSSAEEQTEKNHKTSNVLKDLKTLAMLPNLWLLAAVVFCGYQLFWSTYNFAPYLRTDDYGMGAAIAAVVGVSKMWMRPIGGIGGGFLADKYSRERVLCAVLVAGALGIAALIIVPPGTSAPVLFGLVLFVGMISYAVRGLYWALLEECGVPLHCTGLAIGLVSMIGYSGDIFLPLLSGHLLQSYPGAHGHRIFFVYIVFIALSGALGAWILHRRFNKNR